MEDVSLAEHDDLWWHHNGILSHSSGLVTEYLTHVGTYILTDELVLTVPINDQTWAFWTFEGEGIWKKLFILLRLRTQTIWNLRCI